MDEGDEASDEEMEPQMDEEMEDEPSMVSGEDQKADGVAEFSQEEDDLLEGFDQEGMEEEFTKE